MARFPANPIKIFSFHIIHKNVVDEFKMFHTALCTIFVITTPPRIEFSLLLHILCGTIPLCLNSIILCIEIEAYLWDITSIRIFLIDGSMRVK